jgi:hypothetical protein
MSTRVSTSNAVLTRLGKIHSYADGTLSEGGTCGKPLDNIGSGLHFLNADAAIRGEHHLQLAA